MYAKSRTMKTTARMIQVTIAPPILNERKCSCQVSSGFRRMSPPSGGSETHDRGELPPDGFLHRDLDDFPRRRVCGADAVAQHEGRQPGHILCLDRLPALRRGARLGSRHQVPRRARARAKLDALGRPRLADDADAETRE